MLLKKTRVPGFVWGQWCKPPPTLQRCQSQNCFFDFCCWPVDKTLPRLGGLCYRHKKWWEIEVVNFWHSSQETCSKLGWEGLRFKSQDHKINKNRQNIDDYKTYQLIQFMIPLFLICPGLLPTRLLPDILCRSTHRELTSMQCRLVPRHWRQAWPVSQ